MSKLDSKIGSIPGEFDDDSVIRGLITAAIKQCSNLSRDQIADQMSVLLNRSVTKAQLDSFSAESKDQHRWPLAWTRAFCHVTGDDRLLIAIAERAGLRVIGADDIALLELGRHFLSREDSAEKIEQLKQQLRRRP